ncbi:Ras-related protein Rab-5A [Tritrichomonas foetus]|uniref:Ras-related protein Rab-5A n=1 Tax=Tritrichomonas foetus TaxID=1144522 RepID=A0A1J4JLT5_9EUKA|nr:Ras-related protein Rab-5A [Tritrichomonas foetus]|eukprot:OHS98236.1 Ras-related protein Rab-5A [Tritrichomonas foetus]
MENEVSRASIKAVILGDSSVGKSSIIAKYDTGMMPDHISPTVGAAYLSKIITYDDTEIELRIWDTAGQETYQSLTPIYFRNSSIGFVVFDITQRNTFESIPKWVSQLKEHAGSNILSVLVANKIDLDNNREIKQDEYMQFANQNDMIVTEVSAKSGLGIINMIDNAVSTFIKTNSDFRYEMYASKRKMEQKLTPHDTGKSSCC